MNPKDFSYVTRLKMIAALKSGGELEFDNYNNRIKATVLDSLNKKTNEKITKVYEIMPQKTHKSAPLGAETKVKKTCINEANPKSPNISKTTTISTAYGHKIKMVAGSKEVTRYAKTSHKNDLVMNQLSAAHGDHTNKYNQAKEAKKEYKRQKKEIKILDGGNVITNIRNLITVSSNISKAKKTKAIEAKHIQYLNSQIEIQKKYSAGTKPKKTDNKPDNTQNSGFGPK
jgi:hypothetical protein